MNVAAKQKLEKAMRKVGGKRDLGGILGDTLVCGPFLWEQLKNTSGMDKVGLASTIAIPGTEDGGVKIVQKLDGRTFRSPAEVDDQFSVRKAQSQELAVFWAMVPFDLEEPLFVVESKHHRLLAAFNNDGATVKWIDDLQNLTLDHGRVVNAAKP